MIEDYFYKIDNEEKAYFLGFIAADGYIDKKGYKLSFCLSYKDRDILDKLVKILECKNPVIKRNIYDKRTDKIYEQASLQITNSKIAHSLKKYNINNSKTRNFKIPSIDSYLLRHLLRGLFDGDGYIHTQCTLVSTLEAINQIDKILSDNLSINIDASIYPLKPNKNVYRCNISGIRRIKFLNWIYSDANIYLNRKHIEYKQQLELYNNQIHTTYKQCKVYLYKDEVLVNTYNSIKDCANDIKVRPDTVSKYFAGKYKSLKGFQLIKGNCETVQIKNNAIKEKLCI